jgi:hypothetical protein
MQTQSTSWLIGFIDLLYYCHYAALEQGEGYKRGSTINYKLDNS